MKIKSLTTWISQAKENFRHCSTLNKNKKEQVLQLMIFYRHPTDFKKWVNLTNLTTGGEFTGGECIYNF